MLKIRKMQMDPPSGWVYEVENGHVIKAGTFDKLIALIQRHFEVNGYPIPDNLREVVEHEICMLNPQSICKGDGPTRFFPSRRQVEEGTEKLLKVRREISEAGSNAFVSQEEADRRAQLCVACPMKRNLWGCFVCDKLVKMVTKTYKRETSYDKLSYGCGVCGCINSAQVWLEDFVLAKVTPKETVCDYPQTGCWKRTALENYYGKRDTCPQSGGTARVGNPDHEAGEAPEESNHSPATSSGDLP